MKELPADVAPYRRTPEFTAASTPAGLLASHRTRPGTWGEIVVLAGTVLYRVHGPPTEEIRIGPERAGVIEPTVSHAIEPSADARFFVRFYRRPDRGAG